MLASSAHCFPGALHPSCTRPRMFPCGGYGIHSVLMRTTGLLYQQTSLSSQHFARGFVGTRLLGGWCSLGFPFGVAGGAFSDILGVLLSHGTIRPRARFSACIALKILWVRRLSYRTTNEVQYGIVCWCCVVVCNPFVSGIIVILLLLDCKDNEQSTRVVWPLGLGLRTWCVAPWVGNMDPQSMHLGARPFRLGR